MDTQKRLYIQDMDPGPAKILRKPEKLKVTLRKCVAVWKGRWLSTAARHRKISEEHQSYLPSNTHLEGKLSSKYYLRFTGQFWWEMAGFFNGLLRKRAKASRIVYISWWNKISSKGQTGSTCMRPLASEITFAKKKLYHVQKQLLYLLEFNFERIIH